MFDMDYVWNNYKDWLLWRVGLNVWRKKTRNYGEYYEKLLTILHNTSFKILIERDQNRAEDGMDLRSDYYDYERDVSNIVPFGFSFCRECSVLEMLVALAIRIDDEYIGNPSDPDPESIFLEMLDNLGLLEFTHYDFLEKEVYDILERWLSRKFKWNGEGSIFPLKYTKTDQRDLEIWDQMQEYLNENY